MKESQDGVGSAFTEQDLIDLIEVFMEETILINQFQNGFIKILIILEMSLNLIMKVKQYYTKIGLRL